MTYYEFLSLIFDGFYNPVIAMSYKCNTISSHTINVLLARCIPDVCAFTKCNVYGKSLIQISYILVFTVQVAVITVQLLCCIAA